MTRHLRFFGIFGIFSGLCGLGFVGSYEFTKKTFAQEAEEYRIISTEEGEYGDVWDKSLEFIKRNSTSLQSWSKDFKPIYEEIISSDDSSKLIDWCKKMKTSVYSDFFKKEQTLLTYFKFFCSISIAEIIDLEDTIFTHLEYQNRDSLKEPIQKKLEKLKNYSGEEGELAEELKKIKNDITKRPSENDWLALANWCENSFGINFVNDKEPLWKQINYFCGKD